MNDITKDWKLYQNGIDYNTKLDLYARTELHWNFYNDKQWIGVTTNGLPKWTFNICKAAINYFVSFICSQKVKMQYSADNIPDNAQDPADQQIKQLVELMSNMADMKWEKDKMDSKLRELILDGGVGGDFCGYVLWDPEIETGQYETGDFTTEVVDGINVMFGNPNSKKVKGQPYILIVGRDLVTKLKEEAKKDGRNKQEIEQIKSDSDTQYTPGAKGKIEIESKDDNGKCNYVIKFWKSKNGNIWWKKFTESCLIRKDTDLGISRYPIAWGNWETVKDSYHGMPVIEGIIDNQISINQLFAMVSYWMKLSAFGKVIYDGTRLEKWSNKIGEALKANGEVQGIVQQIQGGNFNAAILEVINLAIKYTKDFIGANDALLGQVNPEQASGVSIVSTAKQASMPLGNITANRDQFVEDLGLIWAEFFLKKYKNRKVAYKQNGKVVTDQYNTENIDLSKLLLQCKVDVGPSSYWSEIQGIQALDNLLKNGKITNRQYFERMAKLHVIPDCQGLLEDAIKQEQMAQQQQQMQQQQIQGQQQQAMMQQQAQQQQQMMAQQQQQSEKQAQYEKMAQFVEQLPRQLQARLQALPPDEMEKAILQLMRKSVQV